MEIFDKYKEKKSEFKKNNSFHIKSSVNRSANEPTITISTPPVGQLSSTLNKHNDYYVYEWFIKETAEVFYVGKGRENRYKSKHERFPDFNKIQSMYDTDVKFIAKGLPEDKAIELESEEMNRILNETDDILVNRIVQTVIPKGRRLHRINLRLLQFFMPQK